MLSAQLSGLIVDVARAAGEPTSALTEGPYGWIGGLLIFAIAVTLFVRSALLELKKPAPTAETNVHMDGPLHVALRALDVIAKNVAELPASERRMIELRDHFAEAVETTRRNFYVHVERHDREVDIRIRALEQKVAVLESFRRAPRT